MSMGLNICLDLLGRKRYPPISERYFERIKSQTLPAQESLLKSGVKTEISVRYGEGLIKSQGYCLNQWIYL